MQSCNDAQVAEKTTLNAAIRSGDDHIAAQLLAQAPHLADFEVLPSDNTLHLAAEHGCAMVVAQLLAHRPALSNSRDRRQQTALHRAAVYDQDKVVASLLFAHNVRSLIDAQDYKTHTALHLAASHGHARVAALLLAHKPAVVDEIMCLVALQCGKESGEDVLRLLLAHKPELIRTVNCFGNNVLHFVFGFRSENTYFSEALMTQVWQSIPPDALHATDSPDKLTPFDWAVRCDNQFAINMVQGKLSLEEIVHAFIRFKKDYHHCVVAKVVGMLAPWLLHVRDVVEMTISGYLLGFSGEKSECMSKKRMREKKDFSSSFYHMPFLWAHMERP